MVYPTVLLQLFREVIWRDENGNGEQDPNDKGFSSAQLFLDQNGNFQLDENETTFEPSEDGTFTQPVPPGPYCLCVQPKNPDANVTFPIEAQKAYLGWTDFESSSVDLNFGIQDNSEQEQNSSAPQNQPPPKDQGKSKVKFLKADFQKRLMPFTKGFFKKWNLKANPLNGNIKKCEEHHQERNIINDFRPAIQLNQKVS